MFSRFDESTDPHCADAFETKLVPNRTVANTAMIAVLKRFITCVPPLVRAWADFRLRDRLVVTTPRPSVL